MPTKISGDQFFATEAEALRQALNQHADLLDANGFEGIAATASHPAFASAREALAWLFAQPGFGELVLPQQVQAGNLYLTSTGIWAARYDFNAKAAPVSGPNWRLVAGFVGQASSIGADGITDATDAGRRMLRAADAAAQRALVNNPNIAEDAYGKHPRWVNTDDPLTGLYQWLIRNVLALLAAQPISPPAVVPAVTGFLPASAAVGATVTITGSLFTKATAVLFNGTPASFQIINATTIVAVVPTGATTGPVSVSTATGTGTSAASFTVGASSGGGATPELKAALALSLAQITLGASVGYSITASGGTGPYGYAVTVTDVNTGQTYDLGTAKSSTWQPNAADHQYAFDSVVTDAAGKSVDTTTRYLNVVPATNRIPVADAGQDVTLPVGSTSLALLGQATDPDGDAITGHAWRYVVGPNVPAGLPASTQNVVVSNLVAGTYQFGYRATDSRGGQSVEVYVMVTVPQASYVPLIKLFGQSNNGGLARRSDLYSATLNTANPSFTREFLTRIGLPGTSTLQRLQVGQPSFDGTGGGNELGLQGSDHPSDYEDGFGPEIGLAQRLEQEGILNAVLAKYAKGATSIKRWLKSANDLYPLLKAAIVNARAAIVAAGGTPDEKGTYWDQWETDLGSTTYQADLQQLYNDLRADGLIGANEKFVVCAAQNADMLAQQQAFVAANAAARLLTPASIAYIPNDQLHYDARTQLAIGGNSLYNILFNTTGSISIPPPQKLLNPVILHAWEGGSTGAQLTDLGVGGQHATQSVASRQPTLVQNALFGRAALSYTQTDVAQYQEIAALAAGANEVTIMVTFQSTSSASGQVLIDCAKGRNLLYANGLAFDGAGGSQFNSCYYTNLGSNDVTGVRGVNVSGSQPTFMAVAFGTDNGELTVNGDVIGQYKAGVSRLLTNIRLGAAIDAQDTPDLDHNSRFIGLIGGYEIWPGKLTAAQVQARRQVMTGESGGSTPPPTSGAVSLSGATVSTSNGTTLCSARDSGYGHTGSSPVAFPAGKEFSLLLQRTPDSGDAVLGVASAETAFSNMPAGIIFAPGSTDVNSVDGSSIGPRGSLADNGYARIYRAANSTVLKLQTATDKAGPWTELYTFAAKPTGTLYPVCDMKGAASAIIVGVEYFIGT